MGGDILRQVGMLVTPRAAKGPHARYQPILLVHPDSTAARSKRQKVFYSVHASFLQEAGPYKKLVAGTQEAKCRSRGVRADQLQGEYSR